MLIRFGVPLICTTAAFAAWSMLGDEYAPGPYLFFLPAIVISGLYGGRTAGILATALSSIFVLYFHLPPILTFTVNTVSEAIQLMLFAVTSTAISLLTGRLGEAHLRYRALFEGSTEAVLLVDTAGRYLDANPAAETLLGYSRNEIRQMHFGDLSPAELRPERTHLFRQFVDKARRTARGTHDAVMRIRRKDGEDRIVDGRVQSVALPRGEAILVNIRDITVQEQARQALASSEARFQMAMRAVSGIVWEWDATTDQVFRSQGLEQLVGVRPEAARPDRDWWRQRTHPDDLVAHLQRMRDQIDRANQFSSSYRVRHADGHWVDVWERGLAERDASGTIIRIFGFVVDDSDRKSAERRRHVVADVDHDIASSTDLMAMTSSILERVCRHLGTTTCFVNELDVPAGTFTIQFEHAGDDRPISGQYRLADFVHVQPRPDPETDRPIVVHDIRSDPRTAPHHANFARLHIAALASAPCRTRDRVVAELTVASDVPREWKEDEVRLLQDVAARLWPAIERNRARKAHEIERERLLALERRAREEADRTADRLTRLQTVTAGLAIAESPEDVADVVMREGIAALHAIGGTIALCRPDTNEMEVFRATGYSAEVVARWQRFPLDSSTPLGEAALRRIPVWVGSRAERDKRYPRLVGTGDSSTRALAGLPLSVNDELLGAIGLSFVEEQTFPDDQRLLLTSLAELCAQALRRTQLAEEERTARRLAEAAGARLRALAQTSEVIERAGLELPAVAEAVARSLVEFVGDAAGVYLFTEDRQSYHVLALCHRRPEFQVLLEATASPQPRPVTDLGERVTLTGHSQVIGPAEVISLQLGSTPEARAYLDQVGVSGILMVPIPLAERVAGILFLARDADGQPFDSDDVVVAEEIANRFSLAISNTTLYRQTRDAVRARDEFLLIAAHELRTPLTGLLTSSQLLGRAAAKGTLDLNRIERVVPAIERSVQRLKVLINDLLDVARLNAGRVALNREEVDLADLVRRIIAEQPEWAQRSIDLVFIHEPLLALVDRARIEQVLVNLLDNAVKYSPEGGSIRVRICQGDERTWVSVSDQGIGLPAGTSETIFTPFGRAENAQRAHIQGMGLGLYICRQIVSSHGGRIWAESAGEGLGTQVVVELPQHHAESAP